MINVTDTFDSWHQLETLKKIALAIAETGNIQWAIDVAKRIVSEHTKNRTIKKILEK